MDTCWFSLCVQWRQDVCKGLWEGCLKKKKNHAVGGLAWADNESLIETAPLSKNVLKMSSKGEACVKFTIIKHLLLSQHAETTTS